MRFICAQIKRFFLNNFLSKCLINEPLQMRENVHDKSAMIKPYRQHGRSQRKVILLNFKYIGIRQQSIDDNLNK